MTERYVNPYGMGRNVGDVRLPGLPPMPTLLTPVPPPTPPPRRATASEEGARQETATESTIRMTNPMAQDVFDTIAQLDTDVQKLSYNAVNSSSYINKVDADLQTCIPAVNYATRHVDELRSKFKNIEDSLTLLHDKTRKQRRRSSMHWTILPRSRLWMTRSHHNPRRSWSLP